MRSITVLVCALGGEGGGVLAEWLYGAAVRAGHAAQATSIPGVAQRTGATTYYVEVAPAPLAPGDPRPVFSLSPVPGCVDLLVSSELLETARQASAGFVSRERTFVISSAARALTVAEKMALGDGRADSAALVAALQRGARAVDLLDLQALARETGTAISAVLLGAIAASGVLPLPRSAYEEAIRAAGKGVAASLAGFALAFDTLARRRAQQAQGQALVDAAAPKVAAPALDAPALRALARARVAGYQDEAYARLFDERLARLHAAEAGQGAAAGTPATHEATRWLALWMCFDDIVRVAALKLAASRQARVRREVNAAPGDIVKTYDHFKPGVPELAGLLPAGIAARLVERDRARVAAGRDPWALPMKVGTHGLLGALALRFVAALKGQRRRGQRFALEQSLIERWLAAVRGAAARSTPLALEIAACAGLLKGYGETHRRGRASFLAILDALVENPPTGDPAAQAAAIRRAREAALADPEHKALAGALGRPVTWLRAEKAR